MTQTHTVFLAASHHFCTSQHEHYYCRNKLNRANSFPSQCQSCKSLSYIFRCNLLNLSQQCIFRLLLHFHGKIDSYISGKANCYFLLSTSCPQHNEHNEYLPQKVLYHHMPQKGQYQLDMIVSYHIVCIQAGHL